MIVSENIEQLIRKDIIEGRKVRELWYEPLYHRIKYQQFTRIYKDIKSRIIYRSQATYTYSSNRGTIELRIWKYQKGKEISEQETYQKWNEANDNAVKLSNDPVIDSMDPTPGFEHNIVVETLVGSIDTWYGELYFGRGTRYKVL